MENKKILRFLSILALSTMLMSGFSMTGFSAQTDLAIQKDTTENLTQADLTTGDIDFEEDLPVKKESLISDDGTFRYTTFTNKQVSYAVFDKALTPDVTKFVVPNKIKGVEITTIGGSAFSHMTKLKQVTIGKYVYSIGGKAFKGCTSLNKINLNKVCYFGKESFSGCKALKSIDLTKDIGGYCAEFDKMAFYNCKNLKIVKIYDEVFIHSNAFGYYKNGSNNYAKVPNFKLIVSTNDRYGDGAFSKDGIGYCHNNDIDCVYKLKSSHTKKLFLWAGFAGKFKVDNKSLTEWTTSNSKVLNIDRYGNFVALKKGAVTVKAKKQNGETYSKRITVKNDPKLLESNIQVKKGTSYKVKIQGKANSIDNEYGKSSIAEITSKKSAKAINIKGLKSGKTTLNINVNGVILPLKVKVI